MEYWYYIWRIDHYFENLQKYAQEYLGTKQIQEFQFLKRPTIIIQKFPEQPYRKNALLEIWIIPTTLWST